jgi:hypothetical protein
VSSLLSFHRSEPLKPNNPQLCCDPYIHRNMYIYIHICGHIYTCIHRHKYVFILVSKFTYVYMYMYVYTCIYTLINVYIYTYIHRHKYVFILVYIFTYMYVHIHIHAYIYTLKNIYMYMCLYILTYKHVHTQIHKYTNSPPLPLQSYLPSTSSGARYSGVPHNVNVFPPALNILANPKSISFGYPSLSIKQFSGFKSLDIYSYL